MKCSIGLREGRALGAAGIPGRPGGEEGTLAHNPKLVEDLNIQGEKRTGILRTRLKKSCEFQAGKKRRPAWLAGESYKGGS